MLRELSLKARRRREASSANAAAASPSSKSSPSDQAEASASTHSGGRSFPALPRRLSRGPGSFHRASSMLSGRQPRGKPPPQPSLPSGNPIPRPRLRPSKSDVHQERECDVNEHSPPVFPKKPGSTYPLVTVDELMRWRPTGQTAKCVSRVPLSPSAVKRYVRGQSLPGRPSSNFALNVPPSTTARGAAGSLKRLQPPRLLLCHDFRGGYPDWEAKADGVAGPDCPKHADMWRFNHWAYVDIFVYFSHHCVTIPPVGYIQAAHRHGSLVLGTLIFERDVGANELAKILTSFKTRARAASQLASIAKFYGFDGWLLNVEVELKGGSAMASDLAAFVSDLTRATRKILGQVSEVVWYDSVTRDGSLKWQNELNQDNEQYFKAAGSIFTNYHWDRNAPVRSAVKAGTRRTDVFMGIDTHGRNTYGGGGFQTHLALRAIKQGGTSAAIFAPAWTVEKCPPNVDDPRELEDRFWTGPPARFGRDSVSQYFKERAVVTDLPFSTTFDPGWGPWQVRNGVVKDSNRYFNMAQQQVQPSYLRTYVAAGDTTSAALSLSHDEAYNGSASVKVQFSFSESRMLSGSFSIMRLLVANLAFPTRLSSRITKSQEGAVQISYDFLAKSDVDSRAAADDFGLVLMLSSSLPIAVFLVGENSKWNIAKRDGMRRTTHRIQVLGKFINYEICVASSERKSFGAPGGEEGSTGWITRRFVLEGSLSSGQRLAEVMVIAGGPPQQPVSVRPSPFMSPSGSRVASRGGSRVGSKYGSRVGSASVSRSNSPPRSRRDEYNDEAAHGSVGMDGPDSTIQPPPERPQVGEVNSGDAFGGSLLQQYRESFGQRRRSEYVTVDGNARISQQVAFERRQESTPGLFQSSLDRQEVVPVRQLYRNRGAEVGQGVDRAEGMQRGSSRQGSYSYNFQVGGTIDFGSMKEADIGTYSDGASRALSRLGSRLQTPMGSRPMSQVGSRNASLAGSLVASRNASRQGSRLGSPSVTPRNGGGRAIAISGREEQEGKSGIGLPNELRSKNVIEINNSGAATPSRNSAVLSDLKCALMQAAGEMAGDGPTANGHVSRGTDVVYLGGLSISLVPAGDSSLPGVFQRQQQQQQGQHSFN